MMYIKKQLANKVFNIVWYTLPDFELQSLIHLILSNIYISFKKNCVLVHA